MELKDFQRRQLDIGTIVAWLLNIEYSLRWWLTSYGGHDIVIPNKVGQVVKKTPMTDYRSLRELIVDYNSRLSDAELKYSLDHTIVEIRDTLAHGRCFALKIDGHMTLYKYAKPRGEEVETLAMKELSPEVLKAELAFLRKQFYLVHECCEKRRYID